MKLRVVLGGLIAAVAFVVVPTALSNPGDTPDQAFPITIGQVNQGNDTLIYDSTSGLQFWAMTLAKGDKVTMDVQSDDWYQAITVYVPGMTDFNYDPFSRDTRNIVYSGRPISQTTHAGQAIFTATQDGRSVIGFSCACQTGTLGGGPYGFTVLVQQATQMQVGAPALAKRARSFAVSGTVSTLGGVPANSKVALTIKGPGMKKPLSMVVTVTSNGRFATHLRLPHTGTYVLTATYYGDATHRASAATAKVHVG